MNVSDILMDLDDILIDTRSARSDFTKEEIIRYAEEFFGVPYTGSLNSWNMDLRPHIGKVTMNTITTFSSNFPDNIRLHPEKILNFSRMMYKLFVKRSNESEPKNKNILIDMRNLDVSNDTAMIRAMEFFNAPYYREISRWENGRYGLVGIDPGGKSLVGYSNTGDYPDHILIPYSELSSYQYDSALGDQIGSNISVQGIFNNSLNSII